MQHSDAQHPLCDVQITVVVQYTMTQADSASPMLEKPLDQPCESCRPIHGAIEVTPLIRIKLGRWLWMLRMRRNIPPIQLAEHTGINADVLEHLELGSATTLGGGTDSADSDWDRMYRLSRTLTDNMFDADLVIAVVRVVLGMSTTIPQSLLDRVYRELAPPPIPIAPH